MKVTRRNFITGKIHTMDLDITQEQLDEYNSGSGRLIQNIFPNLTPVEREFLMTGTTEEEWDEAFGEE